MCYVKFVYVKNKFLFCFQGESNKISECSGTKHVPHDGGKMPHVGGEQPSHDSGMYAIK